MRPQCYCAFERVKSIKHPKDPSRNEPLHFPACSTVRCHVSRLMMYRDKMSSNVAAETHVSAEHSFCRSDVPCAQFSREFTSDMLDLWLEKAFNPAITKDWINYVAERMLVPQLFHSCIYIRVFKKTYFESTFKVIFICSGGLHDGHLHVTLLHSVTKRLVSILVGKVGLQSKWGLFMNKNNWCCKDDDSQGLPIWRGKIAWDLWLTVKAGVLQSCTVRCSNRPSNSTENKMSGFLKDSS
jgi:hypothetical protein